MDGFNSHFGIDYSYRNYLFFIDKKAKDGGYCNHGTKELADDLGIDKEQLEKNLRVSGSIAIKFDRDKVYYLDMQSAKKALEYVRAIELANVLRGDYDGI